MEFLKVDNLCRSFGGLKAVNGVSFSVKENMIKAIIGPNGAGKTTLFNLISGFIPPNHGEVYFNNGPIHGLQPYQIAETGISRTFQNLKLFPGMTVLENVMIGRHTHGKSEFLSGMLNLPWTWIEEKKIKKDSIDIMDFLGIADYADTDATSLAYGQQRIVELARAMACEPQLLLLDEPAAGLNMRETAEMAKLITKLRDRGITILLVEHDMSLVMNISDEILVLCYGEKIADDAPLAVQQNDEVIRVYLGDDDA
jgi:branched-chain amino acid transport system ATP-binding protein